MQPTPGVAVRGPLEEPAPLVHSVLMRMPPMGSETGRDAEDVTSETFARALRYRTSFNAKKGSPAAWLIGITRRAPTTTCGSRASRVPTDDELLPQAAGEPEAGGGLRLNLHAAVATLGTRDRELIALRWGGTSRRAISRHLSTTHQSRRSRARPRALERLRATLEPGLPSQAMRHGSQGRPRAAASLGVCSMSSSNAPRSGLSRRACSPVPAGREPHQASPAARNSPPVRLGHRCLEDRAVREVGDHLAILINEVAP